MEKGRITAIIPGGGRYGATDEVEVTQALKRRLFAVGTEAVKRISPFRDLYASPRCRRLLPIEAIDAGELTLEHVPPESTGGKGIALTGERCNSTAGHTVDAAVHGRERTSAWAGRFPGGQVNSKERRRSTSVG